MSGGSNVMLIAEDFLLTVLLLEIVSTIVLCNLFFFGAVNERVIMLIMLCD